MFRSILIIVMDSLRKGATLRSFLAILCAILLVPGDSLAQGSSQAAAANAKIPPDQMDSLVAPIALYPDPLLAQVLAASTYPLELIQLQQWLEKNKNLKGQQLADAAARQPWDPSVQAMAGLPDLVKRLADDIQWTTDLGNAFLAQQSDVMEAVQRMRKKAEEKGTLKTTSQQTVQSETVEGKTVVVIEPANPEVVYVPSYNPEVVYGPPVYPYPPIYYPPPGYYAAGAAIAFGVGVAMGAWWGGGWGWGCGWGGGNVYINHFNSFNRNTIAGRPGGGVGRPGGVGGVGGVGRPGGVGGVGGPGRPGGPGGVGGVGKPGGPGGVGGVGGIGGVGKPGGPGGVGGPGGAGGRGNWAHNPAHRGGAPYKDRATADRFGGTTRGDSLANRQAGARQQIGRQGGQVASRPASPGGSIGNRPGGGSPGNRVGGAGAANRAGSMGGGPNGIGNRNPSRGGGGGNAFGGGAGGFNGANARMNSNRGGASLGNRGGGGGFNRGGGGFNRGGGGGFRGGGGGARRGGGGGRRR